MQIRVTLKDPDSLFDAAEEAAECEVEAIEGLHPAERPGLIELRSTVAYDVVTARWMPDGEYLTVEFDTEAGTARVVSRDELEGRSGHATRGDNRARRESR